MKLLRWGPPGRERPGIVAGDGSIRDLSSIVPDIDGTALQPDALAGIAAADPARLPAVPADTRLGPCVGGTRQFLAIGLNYVDHAEEAGQPIPDEPIMFAKMISCLCGPNDNILQPRGSTKLDWEVELCIVIGRGGRHIDEADAGDHIAGYCICNDISERHFQLERCGQWVKGKSGENFGPVGPWMVTADEVGDPQRLDMWLDVDGRRMQTGNTRTMIFGCHHIVAYVSRFMALEPGDLITTGTPPGVALGRTPPPWLQPGQIVTLGIEKLGQQCQTVVAAA